MTASPSQLYEEKGSTFWEMKSQQLQNSLKKWPVTVTWTCLKWAREQCIIDTSFCFRKQKRNCTLLKRDDVITWWRQYLHTIRQLRPQQRMGDSPYDKLSGHYMDNWVFHSPNNLGPRIGKSRHQCYKKLLSSCQRCGVHFATVSAAKREPALLEQSLALLRCKLSVAAVRRIDMLHFCCLFFQTHIPPWRNLGQYQIMTTHEG